MLSETYVHNLIRRAKGETPYRPYAALLEKALSRFPERLTELNQARALQSFLTAKSREARTYELDLVIAGHSPEAAAELAREQLLSELTLLEASETPDQ